MKLFQVLYWLRLVSVGILLGIIYVPVQGYILTLFLRPGWRIGIIETYIFSVLSAIPPIAAVSFFAGFFLIRTRAFSAGCAVGIVAVLTIILTVGVGEIGRMMQTTMIPLLDFVLLIGLSGSLSYVASRWSKKK